MSVHSSIFIKAKSEHTTNVWLMGKQNVVYTYNGIKRNEKVFKLTCLERMHKKFGDYCLCLICGNKTEAVKWKSMNPSCGEAGG